MRTKNAANLGIPPADGLAGISPSMPRFKGGYAGLRGLWAAIKTPAGPVTSVPPVDSGSAWTAGQPHGLTSVTFRLPYSVTKWLRTNERKAQRCSGRLPTQPAARL